MNEPITRRPRVHFEVSDLRRKTIGNGAHTFQSPLVMASLLLLAGWALPFEMDLGAVTGFLQISDTSEQHIYDGATTVVDLPLPEVIQAFPDLQGLEAARSQEELSRILDSVGDRAKALLESLPNTSSREDITEERLSRDGRVKARRVESSSYLILVQQSGEGRNLVEYRTDLQGNVVGPQDSEGAFSLTKGFASMWVHFHPSNRSAARFRLLGRQRVNEHATYVVAFAQRPGWATVFGKVFSNGRSALILYQGIAWIDVASCRIVRMRTDLLAPRQDIGLERQTTVIEFGEVHFPGVSSPVWLPHEVVVTTESSHPIPRGRTRKGLVGSTESEAPILRNRHRYSDYKLFRAESTIKPIPPGQ
jgi:hypothetical protein